MLYDMANLTESRESSGSADRRLLSHFMRLDFHKTIHKSQCASVEDGEIFSYAVRILFSVYGN